MALLAPFVAKYQSQVKRDYVSSLAFLGTLGMLNETLGSGGQVPARVLSAKLVFGNLVARDEITQAVRESARTMCVVAADDASAVEIGPALEVCQSKLGSRKNFVYPAKLGVGHDLTPHLGNKYGIALMDQAAKFFSELPIDDADFLVTKNFTS